MSESPKTLTLGVIAQVALVVVMLPLLPLLISGRWDWWEAWAYAAACVLSFFASRALVARIHPDLIVERAHATRHEDVKSWDKLLAPLVGLGGALIPLVAGLDARFSWSRPFPALLKWIALIVLLGGFAWSSYAVVENRFFSGMVRIQADRGHQVVSSGPYRWMRHPGYAGAMLSYLAIPIFLDSAWAYLATAAIAIPLILRTAFEDRTLQAELPGYRDYAQSVRYRLIPGVW